MGSIDKIVSSKSSVKSNPPRQLDAWGPNVLSIMEGQDIEDGVAMATRDELFSF
jgi:hypothetical protein